MPCAGTAFALAQAGGPRSDVVRTRMYVTDISPCVRWGRYTRRCSGEIRPVVTMVEASALISPVLYVEIEADAHVD